MGTTGIAAHREPWNKGKIVGQKAPFKPQDIWALRVRLQMESRVRELALINLGIDSKLRGCDLVALRVRDVCHGDQVATRAIVMQHKTQRPVQFEITQATRDAALQAWIRQAMLKPEDFLFPSRLRGRRHQTLALHAAAAVLGPLLGFAEGGQKSYAHLALRHRQHSDAGEAAARRRSRAGGRCTAGRADRAVRGRLNGSARRLRRGQRLVQSGSISPTSPTGKSAGACLGLISR
jgi:hypothetical protein